MAKNIAAMKRGWHYDESSESLDLMVDGKIVEKFGGGYPNIHKSGTTQLYPLGTRLALPDGRVYRYALSSGACYAGQGADFVYQECAAYTTIGTTAAIGATTVDATAVTHTVLTKDELVGGYMIIYGASNADVQFRGILGNDASVADTAITGIKIDAPLVAAVTGASTGCEVFYNPYSSIALATGTNLSKAGVPAVEVAASGTYFWLQTWGPCWVAPQNASFADANDRAAYWRHDGSIEGEIANASKNAGLNSTQYAGFLITEGFTAGPLLMLQVSP
jgi:hypothetical protein